MNTTNQCFIGIDVSKLHFDAALMVITNHQKGPILTQRFGNDAKGLQSFGKWIKSHGAKPGPDTLIVMENTGIYHRQLWAFCSKEGLPVHIGNAAQIKWSLGITRGKDDITDSIRLCRYAVKEADVLKAAPALNPALIRLKDMQTSRTRLLAQVNANLKYLRELKNVSDRSAQKVLEQAYKTAIEGLRKSIKALEMEIKTILKAHEDLNRNYKLLLSVPGIGHITAVYLLCCTCNFIARPSGKQLASYAGLAPFGRSSGSSVRHKPKVHKMANKELKALLHMGARSVIQNNAEMRAYYERKTAEGKAELSVVNAVKNKIILRAVAVVNNQRPYVNKASIAA